jgi:hypothetical protein
MSQAHIDIIKEAVKNGVFIEGYSLVTPGPSPAKSTNAVDKPEVERVKVSNEKVVAEPAPILYPEDEFVAVEWVDGKKVKRSMREVCRNTRTSLVACPCQSHRIVASGGRYSEDGVTVTIERL